MTTKLTPDITRRIERSFSIYKKGLAQDSKDNWSFAFEKYDDLDYALFKAAERYLIKVYGKDWHDVLYEQGMRLIDEEETK